MKPLRRRLSVWRHAAAFYPAKIIKTVELDPEGNYIFAAHPHGIFCSSLFLAFATEGMNFSKVRNRRSTCACRFLFERELFPLPLRGK